jgi:ligand-binding SRPBCC domain-containing protein
VIVSVSTNLAAPAARVWDAVKRPDTLRYVTRGLLGFRPLTPIPDRMSEGDVFRLKLLFFGFLPGWAHEIRIVRLDEERRRIETSEGGGAVKTWNHVIAVDPADGDGTRYSDRIEIEAGPLTPVVAGYAHLFYRYRQRRWRKLAQTLR